ncbi:MAG: M20/M25/M40 family metallo-hydrolase [Oscillospiraceae bacterium]|nr:M20/M25/M40 family metallo-hydrolase [Oscillospiraceae bacterium]
MDKLLQKLVPPVSVSGREEEISRVIETLAKPYGQISRDHLGNLVVHKPGNGRRILLAAHMDTIGLIVTHVDEKGFVRFAAIGGLRLVPMIGQRVKFESGVVGIVCFDRGTEPGDLTVDKLYVDTAGAKVEIGETAAFCTEPLFAGRKVISPYLDNRLGCAVCLKALELLKHTDNDIFCVFTVQEEVGCRGAKPVAYTITPDLAIAVDICGLADFPGDDKPNSLTVEGGPVIKIMDAGVICHPTVVSMLEEAGKRLNIATQRYVTRSGGTDAGAIFNTRGGVPSGVLSIPIRYTHNPNELADLDVAENCAKLLAEAIRA